MRRWLERGVIVLAAVASLATSKKKWHLAAEVTPSTVKQARVIVVEASQRPEVMVPGELLQPMEPATWPGKARYLVPKNAVLDAVMIYGDSCKAKCGEDCEVPEGAYVRIGSTTPVATWTVEATGKQWVAQLKPERALWQSIKLTGTAPNKRATVDSTLPPQQVSATPDRFTVYWPDVTAPTTVTWTPHVVMEGPCPDANPCQPPPDTKLELGPVEEDGYDHTR